MTNYCTVDDVLDLTGTQLEEATIESLIIKADKKVRAILKRAGLDSNIVTVSDEINMASAHFASSLVLRRSMVDGLLPASQSTDGLSASVNVPDSIAFHESEGQQCMQDYFLSIGKATGDFKMFNIVGELGVRNGQFTEMTRNQEEEV